MNSVEEARVRHAVTAADLWLNTLSKEKFSYALIAFKTPVAGEVDLAVFTSGDSKLIIEAFRSAAKSLEYVTEDEK